MKKLNGKIKSFQENKYSLLEKEGKYLKGEIKQKGAEEIFDINGNIIESTSYWYDAYAGEFEATHNTHSRYNSQNKLILLVCDNIGHPEYSYNIEYEYDKVGNLIFEKRLWYRPYFKDFKYDEKNNLIYEKETEGNSIDETNYTNKYDEKGNIIETTKKFGEIEKRIYDTNNNLIESIYCNEDGKTWLSQKFDERGNYIESTSNNGKDKYTFDKENNLIESVKYNKNNENESWVTYETYENNNLIEKLHIELNNFDASVIREIHKYLEFDEYRNWRKKIILCNKEKNYMIIRDIEYHSTVESK